MGQPAARLTDMHVCPMVTPGLPPIPHVGGPITGPGCPTVLIAGLPAAVMGDLCICVGPPDSIVLGSTGVLFGGKPAARMGDSCAHGGTIVLGCPTVLIGETSSGGAGPPATSMSVAQMNAMGQDNALAQGIANAAVTGGMFVGLPVKVEPDKPPPKAIAKGQLNCQLTDQDGNPMAGEKYEIELPDGSIKKGVTDQDGKVSLANIPEGMCKVNFPDIHGSEWG